MAPLRGKKNPGGCCVPPGREEEAAPLQPGAAQAAAAEGGLEFWPVTPQPPVSWRYFFLFAPNAPATAPLLKPALNSPVMAAG